MFHVKHDKKINLGVAFPACDLEYKTLSRCKKKLKKHGIILNILTKPRNQKKSPFRDSAENRAKELEKLFLDDNIDAIICARGGFGSQHVAEHIDYELIKKHPKIIIGYSDITILLNKLNQNTGFVTYHGPMLKEFTRIDDKKFFQKFSDLLAGKLLNLSKVGVIKKSIALKTGKATGRLVGGNLTSICATLSSDLEIAFKNNILFLEDVDEEIYQIDRLLTMLQQNKQIFSCKGIILGNFSKIKNRKIKYDIDIKELFLQRLKDFQGPIIWGYPAGHRDKLNFLPIGKECRIDALEKEVSIQF